MIIIQVPNANDSMSSISLLNKQYQIRFTYNPSMLYWSFGLYEADGTPILPMVRIVPGVDLVRYYHHISKLPKGVFICTSKDFWVRRNAFNNGEAMFSFISDEELGEVGING